MASKTLNGLPARFDLSAVEDSPRLVAAASLALAILGHARCGSWADLPSGVFVNDGANEPKVELDADQVGLLSEHMAVLVTLSAGSRSAGSTSKKRSVAVCEKCGAVLFVASKASTPKRCVISDGCGGENIHTVVLRPVST